MPWSSSKGTLRQAQRRIFGVKAERQSLEDLAKPLTAEDAPSEESPASSTA
jgi:hypothetical protein